MGLVSSCIELHSVPLGMHGGFNVRGKAFLEFINIPRKWRLKIYKNNLDLLSQWGIRQTM